jgi:hypothetical protein
MINSRFENISLVENGVVLSFKSTGQKKISFSEIDKIYISSNKVPPLYVFLFVIISLIVMGFSFWFLDFDLILVLPILLILYGAIRLDNYKRYGMTIALKNADFIELKVPLKLKYEAIDFVNKIKKELFYVAIKR